MNLFSFSSKLNSKVCDLGYYNSSPHRLLTAHETNPVEMDLVVEPGLAEDLRIEFC